MCKPFREPLPERSEEIKEGGTLLYIYRYGPFHVQVDFASRLHALEERTRQWYSHVLIDDQPEKMDHHCRIEAWDTSPWINNPERDEVIWGEDRVEIRSSLQFNYNIDWDSAWNSRLHFVQRTGYDEYEDRSWEFSQRISLFPKLMDMNAFLLHSVCVVGQDGKAIIFLGTSGAGKSTIAQKAIDSGYSVITDDTALLMFVEHELRVYATPYISRSGLIGQPGFWTVGAFVLLGKDAVNTVIPASRQPFVQSLQERIFETQYLTHIFSFSSGGLGGDIAKRLLGYTRKITRQYKAYHLQFNLQLKLDDVMGEFLSGEGQHVR